jgi:hypothetical protein
MSSPALGDTVVLMDGSSVIALVELPSKPVAWLSDQRRPRAAPWGSRWGDLSTCRDHRIARIVREGRRRPPGAAAPCAGRRMGRRALGRSRPGRGAAGVRNAVLPHSMRHRGAVYFLTPQPWLVTWSAGHILVADKLGCSGGRGCRGARPSTRSSATWRGQVAHWPVLGRLFNR